MRMRSSWRGAVCAVVLGAVTLAGCGTTHRSRGESASEYAAESARAARCYQIGARACADASEREDREAQARKTP
ncbi:MAG: hypothetical protein QOI89_2135 [Solirubrobacteraceae bacterium]|nr:hypothetical protein [Solirubrobacteraceae bacterium]